MQNTTVNQMLFIAELNGYKEGTVKAKVSYGIQCYTDHVLPNLDLSTDHGRKYNHEVIWLERIYGELDAVHGLYHPLSRIVGIEMETISDSVQWSVPIEVDMTASMLAIIGALLGSKALLTMTNCIVEDDKLSDAWSISGASRLAVKTVMTPRLYGSNKDASELLKDTKEYSDQLCEEYANVILSSPAYTLADTFKSFILNHARMKPTMVLDTYFEQFEVVCNHHKLVGEYVKYYKAYDSLDKTDKVFRNVHTKKVPDLKRFKSFSVTALVHNLDSIIANYVAEKLYDKYGWGVSIHDAWVVPPQSAEDVRVWVAEGIDNIYQNRNEILTSYFRSLRITGVKASRDWNLLLKQIDKVEGFNCSLYLVK